MVILSKVHKPDNTTESHNSVKLNLEASLESNPTDFFALCEKKLVDLIDFGYFSVRSYLPFIREDYVTHMHGLAGYVKEGLPFTRDFLY